MGVWRQHLRPGDLFLDVGANIGIYTLFALDLGAEVIACEPDVQNAHRLEENLALNDYTAEVVHKAVSNRCGTVRFTQGLDSYNHVVLDGTTLSNAPALVQVETTTVDDLLGDRVAAGLKIDVEGAERLVLEGAVRALHDQRIKLIQLEWSDRVVQRTLGEGRGAAFELLDQAGYVLHTADRRTATLRPLGDSSPPRKDIFALPV
jgi:FkbM family methyltransferase